MGFDDNNSMVGTSASDKFGGDTAGYASADPANSDPMGGGLGGASNWTSSSATGDGLGGDASLGGDFGGDADNTSVGTVNVCS
ncbi:MAG: hypothetical protein ACLFOY_12615 [Desulfatibacillaceae bacterium]